MQLRISAMTSIALVAFAANSVICRLALRSGAADPTGFTAVRLLSGAVVLLAIAVFTAQRGKVLREGSWTSAAALFAYAAAFSFSYLSLDAGIGALFLFGSVQATMIVAGLSFGERLRLNQVVGLIAAILGLVFLAAPGASAPSVSGAALMILAGGAWGVYSLLGRTSRDPVAETASNFIRTLPFVVVLGLAFFEDLSLSKEGVAWAALSGAAASGLGYVIWYAAVKNLKATTAAIVQLTVPVLAAGAGVLLLNEVLTTRLLVCGGVVLAGVLVAVVNR